MKRPKTDYPVYPGFIIVRQGEQYGIAQYSVDTTRNNMMHYVVKRLYSTAHEAENALQVLHEVFIQR